MTPPRIHRLRCNRVSMICMVASALVAWQGAGQEALPTVAVAGIESTEGLMPSPTMQTAIEAAFADIPVFTTLKRKELAALLADRGLSVADAMAGPHEALGVDYLLNGRVVAASVASKLSPLGTLLRVLGSGSDCTAAVGVEVDVVDLATGDGVFSVSVTRREPVEVVYPPGADYSNPCVYANRSRKWRALQAASQAVAAEVAHNVTLALFPMRLVRIGATEVTLNYGDPFVSVGDHLKVIAPGNGMGVGYIAVSAVSSRSAVAEIIHASRPLVAGDSAGVLSKNERRQLDRMLAGMARKAARKERACENARKRVRRFCARDPDSRRCRDAEAAVVANCGTDR